MDRGANDFDKSLGQMREYLRRLARAKLGCHYISKLDPSDVVQQTLLDALENLKEFRGSTEKEQVAWLREIFANNLADIFRAFNRQKRDVSRERSSTRLASWREELPTPSDDASATNEQLIRLAWALSELPEMQHAAIDLHHLQRLSLTETARQLGRTEASVAGLVRRGLSRLRELLNEPPA